MKENDQKEAGERQKGLMSQIINVAYSYSIVKRAAEDAKELPQFRDNVKVQNLMLSDCWIQLFLKRANKAKRRVSASSNKKRPTPEEVRKIMLETQETIAQNHLKPAEIGNADETATYVSVSPLYQYVEAEQSRASAPDGDSKARFTSMLLVKGDSTFAPAFHIMRCTLNKPDITRSTVLTKLHKSVGFTADDGWSYHIWEKEISLRTKRSKTRETKLWYRICCLLITIYYHIMHYLIGEFRTSSTQMAQL